MKEAIKIIAGYDTNWGIERFVYQAINWLVDNSRENTFDLSHYDNEPHWDCRVWGKNGTDIYHTKDSLIDVLHDTVIALNNENSKVAK